jgi:preprotein translocase subunit Sec61beta
VIAPLAEMAAAGAALDPTVVVVIGEVVALAARLAPHDLLRALAA